MSEPRLKVLYREEIKSQLVESFSYSNVMQVPAVDKVVINMGVGESVGEPKALENAVSEMTAIAGQKPALRRAKKAISNFKLREGVPIGCMVNLRGNRMYEFLDRLISIAIPRQRDFRGVSPKSFDGRGNFSMGVTEQIVFAEIDYDKTDRIRGLDINITTTAKTDEQGRALLSAFNFPFREA